MAARGWPQQSLSVQNLPVNLLLKPNKGPAWSGTSSLEKLQLIAAVCHQSWQTIAATGPHLLSLAESPAKEAAMLTAQCSLFGLHVASSLTACHLYCSQLPTRLHLFVVCGPQLQNALCVSFCLQSL